MRLQFIFVVLFSLFLLGCENDLTDLGASAQPASDAIILKIDSLDVSSSNFDVSYIARC
jgi:PBP1b-binding outer membrane lipoprotein LpoB